MNSSANFSANGWNAVEPAQVIAARFGPHPAPLTIAAAHNTTLINRNCLFISFPFRRAGPADGSGVTNS
jgi:hypothetical protein